jgi:hypothetical protein
MQQRVMKRAECVAREVFAGLEADVTQELVRIAEVTAAPIPVFFASMCVLWLYLQNLMVQGVRLLRSWRCSCCFPGSMTTRVCWAI